jgi:hypothetical protein
MRIRSKRSRQRRLVAQGLIIANSVLVLELEEEYHLVHIREMKISKWMRVMRNISSILRIRLKRQVMKTILIMTLS